MGEEPKDADKREQQEDSRALLSPDIPPLREVATQAREIVRPTDGLLKLNYFTLFWIFVAGCIFGLVVETVFHAIVYGNYESRAGLVWGPFSPIYGVGGVLLTVTLNRFWHSHNLIIFVIAMLLGSAIEYSASWFMELMWGAIAWDYSGTFGSIGGRTNFAFGVMWGLLGLIWVRIVLPFLRRVFVCINAKNIMVKLITIGLSAFLVVDISLTVLALDREGQRNDGIAATTPAQQFFDTYFPSDYLQSRMQNMSVYGRGK